jgi:hypothetical protein
MLTFTYFIANIVCFKIIFGSTYVQIVLSPLLDDSWVSHVGGHGLGALNQRRDGYEKVSKLQNVFSTEICKEFF